MKHVAESLCITRSLGDGLLSRGHLVYTTMRDNPPPLIGHAVTQALVKSFPNLGNPDKVRGFKQLMSNPQPHHQQLYQLYYVVADMVEWALTTKSLLLQTLEESSELDMSVNPTLTEATLGTVAIYCRMMFLLASTPHLDALLSIYAQIYQALKMVPEPSYRNSALLVHELKSPVALLIQDFGKGAEKLAAAVTSCFMPLAKVTNVESLRADGLHNVTIKPENMSMPSEDPIYFDMISFSTLLNGVAFGSLASGAYIGKIPIELISMILNESIHWEVYRDVSIHLHDYFLELPKLTKGIAKSLPKHAAKDLAQTSRELKRIIPESQKWLATSGPISVHLQRRIYLRQEIQQTLCIMRSKPGLMGPKAIMCLSALAFAHHELLWLYRHAYGPPPPKAVKTESVHFVDVYSTTLMHHLQALVQLMRKHEAIIRDYYRAYMSGLDSKSCKEELDKIVQMPSAERGLCDSVLADAASQQDLAALRLNWFRAEAAMSAQQCICSARAAVRLVGRFTRISRHSRFTDDLDGMFLQYCPLDVFWHFRAGFRAEFKSAMSSPQPSRAMVYLRLLGEIALHTDPFTPELRDEIGSACVAEAELYLEYMAKFAADLLAQMCDILVGYDGMLDESNAALLLLQKVPNWKQEKGAKPVVPPGTESEFHNRGKLKDLQRTQAILYQLCNALNECVSMQIHDTVLTPREYLKDKLVASLNQHLSSCAHTEAGIFRPSVTERRLNAYTHGFKLIESFVDVNLSGVLRDAFLTQVYHPNMKPLGSQPAPAYLTEVKDLMVTPLIKWFTHFIISRVSDCVSIVYSPVRKAFVSRTGDSFRAEEFVSLVELRALVRLIGPYGVKLLNLEILPHVAGMAAKIKAILLANKQACEESKNYFKSNSATQVLNLLKNFKQLEELVALLTQVGMVLHFRELLQLALEGVMREQVPYLFTTVFTAFNQYKRNTYMVPDYLPTDIVAGDIGLPTETADQTLKLFLQEAVGSLADDAALWDLAPTLFAVAFMSGKWAEADYRVTLEAYRSNLHCTAIAMNALMITANACTSTTRNEMEIVEAQQRFISSGAKLLIAASQADAGALKKTLGFSHTSYDELYIFLDLFVEQSPYLKRQDVEALIPYAFLRSSYAQVFSKNSTSVAARKTKVMEQEGGI